MCIRDSLVADASEEESVTEDNEEWLEEEYEEELDDEYSEYDYDEVESEEDTMEYYISDNNTEDNEMTEEEGTEEKENELLTVEMANKEESSSPLPTVKKQSTAIKPPVKKKSSRYVIPFDKSRYTIQIASKKNLNDAEKVAVNLIESGYDAYIQKAYFRDTDEVWFRVRVGSYDNRDTALSVGKVIADAMTTEVWIDFVRFEE